MATSDPESAVSKPTTEFGVGRSESGGPLRVIVVSSVRLYGEGLARSLSDREGIEPVGVLAPAADLLGEARSREARLCLMDVEVPDVLEHTRRLSRADPAIAVVGFAVARPVNEVVRYIEAGMAAYVPAEAPLDDLCATIARLARGEAVCSPGVTGELFRRVRFLAAEREEMSSVEELTAREQQIVGLIERGMSNKAIAKRLDIRVATVKNHVHNLLGKLGASRRGEAVARVRRSRIGSSA